MCNKKDMDNLIHRFSVIKKCSSDYDCKIHEALLIKKHQPKFCLEESSDKSLCKE